MVPEVVDRPGGSKWLSAPPTGGSKWQSALPTGSKWVQAMPADLPGWRWEDYEMNARLIHEHGVAKIEVNGEVVSSVSFRSFWPQPGITRDFAEGGIRLMNVYPSGILCSLGVPYSQFGEFWVGEGEYDAANDGKIVPEGSYSVSYSITYYSAALKMYVTKTVNMDSVDLENDDEASSITKDQKLTDQPNYSKITKAWAYYKGVDGYSDRSDMIVYTPAKTA